MFTCCLFEAIKFTANIGRSLCYHESDLGWIPPHGGHYKQISLSLCAVRPTHPSTLLFCFVVYVLDDVFFFQNRIKTFSRFFSFILSSDIIMLASLIIKEGVQGLQVFAFCLLTVNDKHTKQVWVQNKA